MEASDLLAALQLIEQQKQAGGVGINSVYKHNQPSGTPSTPYYTGPGGLFGTAQGLPERDVISTRVVPRGLASVLPWRATVKANPLFAYLTGFQARSGSNPTNPCDDAPTPGAGKSCYQTAQFGLYQLDTRELEVNRVGLQIDRAETFDLRLINDPLGRELAGLFPNMPPADSITNGREVLARMIEVGIDYQNRLIQQLYTGNPANNTAGNGYKEFPGLDILIGINKVDALTGIDCPSLDSQVLNFSYAKVTDIASDIVNVMTYMFRNAKYNADRMGLMPVRWVWSMRWTLFYELTAIWPCHYLTYRCAVRDEDSQRLNVNAADQVAMRDAMRAGSYLLIDGEKVEVVTDDGIAEEDEGDVAAIDTGCFASDIYLIPLTIMGGQAVTYWEHLDYAQGAIVAVNDAHYQGEFWTDGGRYLWTRKPQRRWCVQLASKIEPRVIFRAPFLAGRINDVQYCPLVHERQPFNTDNYFVDGGVTTPRAAPSYYSDWNLPD